MRILDQPQWRGGMSSTFGAQFMQQVWWPRPALVPHAGSACAAHAAVALPGRASDSVGCSSRADSSVPAPRATQKRARAESEALKGRPREPQALAGHQGAAGPSGGRAKRSTAGKIRTNRHLESDSDEHADSDKDLYGTDTPAAEGSSVADMGTNKVVMQHPLPVQAGVDASEGMWAGECVGCFQGNKLYSGAVINDQYFAVGSDVFLKAQPGQLQVPPRGRQVSLRLPAAAARARSVAGA